MLPAREMLQFELGDWLQQMRKAEGLAEATGTGAACGMGISLNPAQVVVEWMSRWMCCAWVHVLQAVVVKQGLQVTATGQGLWPCCRLLSPNASV